MPDTTKQAGTIVHLVEELGDARLRCDQLVAYVAEAIRLIENSPHRDHFFEVAGHLLYAAPVTLQKLQKSLQAVAYAANQIDSEELKHDLRPEKVEQLEKALENVRIRQIRRRSEPTMITPQYVAEKLRQIAATTRKFQLPQTEVVQLISDLERGQKQAEEKVPLADMLDRFADAAENGNKDYPRLAAILRRMVGDVHVKGTLAALQEQPVETRTAGASEALQFKELTKKRLPAVIRNGKNVDAWISEAESVLGGYIDLLAHDKWAKEKLFMVSDEVREFKASATKMRATLATLKKVIENNYLSLAESINPNEKKTEAEWAGRQAADGAEAWKTEAAQDVEAYGYRGRGGYAGDPRWIRAKYPGTADDGTPFKKGEEVLYWPRTKTFMVGKKAEQAWRDFQSQAADEDVYGGGGPGRAYAASEEYKAPDEHVLKRAVDSFKRQADALDSAFKKYQSNPGKYQPQLENVASAARQVYSVSRMLLRAMGVKLASDDEEKSSRFEEGKPADPTKNMSPEDKKKWKAQKEQHKDEFKKDAALAWKAEGADEPPFASDFQDVAESWKVEAARSKDAMKGGGWYKQDFSDYSIYFHAISQQKNGGWSGLLVRDYGTRAEKAKKTSVRNPGLWTQIRESEVPPKVMAKFKAQMSQEYKGETLTWKADSA